MIEPGENLATKDRREWLILGLLLAWVLGLRLLWLDQPILENYVGRQIPTAMVARNLDRGSGFLRPTLDTEPSPNLFLVEPPLYALGVVGLRRLTGLEIAPAGRALSALGTLLAAWGLYGLARRREEASVALTTLAAWSFCPLTIRYGRAVQPDMLTLGLWIGGINLVDRGLKTRIPGLILACLGLTMKVISAPLFVPLLIVFHGRRRFKLLFAAILLIPAALWYAHAGRLLGEGGSRASGANGAIWLAAFLPGALLEAETWGHIARFAVLRGMTPPGFFLAIYGLTRCDPFWRRWALASVLGLLVLAAKLHHEYYWLVLAPVASVGIGRSLVEIWRSGKPGRIASVGLAALMIALSLIGTRSTWQTPPEWASWQKAVREIQRVTPGSSTIVAPEALLYLADRRGCRMEESAASARRAALEWPGPHPSIESPIDLLEFYRARGATHYADLTSTADDSRRATFDQVRRRYTVIVDDSGVLIVRLNAP